MRPLYIIGAGGFGREVLWAAERCNGSGPVWDIRGFIDDREDLQGSLIDDYPVTGTIDTLLKTEAELWAVCAVGSAQVRRKIVTRLRANPNIRSATIIDPAAVISDRVTVGEGTIICAGTVVTVDISIGAYSILNLNCTVGHDTVLGSFFTAYPDVNISGNVTAGECVEFGTGSQVIQGIRIGRETIIGAGAVVIRDLPERCTAVGNPARPIKFRTEQDPD